MADRQPFADRNLHSVSQEHPSSYNYVAQYVAMFKKKEHDREM